MGIPLVILGGALRSSSTAKSSLCRGSIYVILGGIKIRFGEIDRRSRYCYCCYCCSCCCFFPKACTCSDFSGTRGLLLVLARLHLLSKALLVAFIPPTRLHSLVGREGERGRGRGGGRGRGRGRGGGEREREREREASMAGREGEKTTTPMCHMVPSI